MKLTLSVPELQEVIKKAQKSLPKKASLKILGQAKLSATNNNITLTTTDLVTTVIYNLNGDIEEPGEIILSPETLKLIAKLKNTYELTIEEGKIKAGNKDLKFKSCDIELYPKIQDSCSNLAFTISEKELIKNLSVNYACAVAENRPVFTGVWIDKNVFIACDTHRMAWKESQIENSMDHAVVIPNQAVKLLSGTLLNKRLDNMVKVSHDKDYKFLKFEFNNVTVITRLIEEQIMNYKQVIPNKFITTVKINIKSVLDELLFIDEICKKEPAISMAIDNNHLYIDAMAEDNAVTLTIDTEVTGEKIDCIGINYHFLLDELKNVDSEEIEVKFTSKYGAMVFGNSLVLPVRLENNQRRNIA